MSKAFETLSYYLQFDFVRYAIIVGTLISLSASLLGVTLVLKRYSFIGDGLSHVAFGAVAVASVLGVTSSTIVVLPITILCAILLLKTGSNGKVKGDASIAMLSVGALAIGYLLMHIFKTSSNVSGDVCSTLFGSTSILTLQAGDVWFSVVLSAIVLLLFIFLYNRIFAVTFDENFSKATGVKADRYNLIIAVIIAVIIVMGMKLIGSLLISALIVFPSLTAMRLFHTFKGVVIVSALVALFTALFGMVISITASLPVGATIVALDIFIYLIASVISIFGKRR